ncbi:hypothetical protein L226DRAFT_533852 [Lentinus tigrinus ALCF2SS1-7]|uniref:uncharacterized protein n=1 Tax=Lentinus tigrinus ALCF2SS1-7 TaxID=1328758 RepID=UPI00116628C1|nr:hypothetical protein L226DRAFT_533852 [Lentinus tigrinus ALCF2SS1-7]
MTPSESQDVTRPKASAPPFSPGMRALWALGRSRLSRPPPPALSTRTRMSIPVPHPTAPASPVRNLVLLLPPPYRPR